MAIARIDTPFFEMATGVSFKNSITTTVHSTDLSFRVLPCSAGLGFRSEGNVQATYRKHVANSAQCQHYAVYDRSPIGMNPSE